MNEASKQALLSALRSLLIIAGTSLSAKGVIAAGNVEILAGVIVTVIPIVWGIADKYIAERKAQAREDAAARG